MMLRRAIKRKTKEDSSSSIKTVKTQDPTESIPLGDTSTRDEAETVLEKLVLGGEEEIVDKLGKSENNLRDKTDHRGILDAPEAVWEDDDDKEVKIKVSQKDFRHKYVKLQGEKEISGEEYSQVLRHQYEKITGTPTWAQMKWEVPEPEQEDDSDTETSDLLQSTGNYLATSEFLPSGIIQMKKCTNANKESPSNNKLKSVEFHPKAQVLLTSGLNQTLNLFQVDGKINPKIQSVFLKNFPIHTAHFSADGQEVIMGSRQRHFYYYDMIGGKIVNVPWIKGLEENNMDSFVVSPDGKYLAFLGKYGHIHILSAKAKEWICTVKMNGSVEAVTFNSDGSKMFSVGDDGEVYVWDMTTRDCVHRFVDEGCIRGTSLAVSRNNRYFAVGSTSGVVNIYNDACLLNKTPVPEKAIMNLTTRCDSLVFNNTAEMLAIASSHRESALKLFHVPSLTTFSNFPTKSDNIRIPNAIDFSLHSGYFTIGNHRGEALLYRVKHYNNY